MGRLGSFSARCERQKRPGADVPAGTASRQLRTLTLCCEQFADAFSPLENVEDDA